MHEFLARTLPLLGEEGIHALSQPLISISGLGGVGGGAFLNLVRCGVKRFRLAENGIFDPPDMNRQAAAFASTMGRPKLDVYAQLAREINPDVELELFPEGVQVANLERFLDGCDAHIGVIDVEKGADVKRMTPELLRRFHIPLFTAGVMGFGTLLVAHEPDGMMPDEFWGALQNQTADDLFASPVMKKFNQSMVGKLNSLSREGVFASTSVGGSLAGTVLAMEVLVYLLRGTGLIDREPVFAPRVIVLDLMGPVLEVVDAVALGSATV